MNTRLFRGIRQIGKYFERTLTLFKWYMPKRNQLRMNYTAHMLAVKNPNYLRIGQIAVVSFLFHNPGSKVVIHCDKITKTGAENVFKFFIKKGLVNLSEVSCETDPWQIQKMQLFKQICNLELNFYMDCDVRWNGTLELPKISACYVREFKLKDKSPFRELISILRVVEPEVEMLNSTFIYLFPGHFEFSEFNQIFLIYEDILHNCRSGLIADLDIEQIERLSEQLAFSIFMANSGRDFSALKSQDGHMDGSFLESSYFGATGIEF